MSPCPQYVWRGQLELCGCGSGRREGRADPVRPGSRTGSGPAPGGDLAGGALVKSPVPGPAQGLTCGTCRTIVVKKDKCLVIYRFSRGRLQSVSEGLQRHGRRPPPGRAGVSCGEAECAGQFFRIWPDATISIARITDSDAVSGGNGALKHKNFAESYRLVTAGDGRWTQGPCIWGYLRRAPSGHQGQTTYNARIATSIQEERPHQCPHALQRPSRY